jgi:hypothetical protein
MENSTLTPDFDAWLQNVILVKTDGSTIELNLAAFDWFRMYTARIAINYGTQVGASIILLTVLLLLTRSEKRKSCLFITNALCLMVNIIRMVLCCCFTTSTIWNPFTQLTNNYAQVTERDLATAAAADVFAFLLSILIMVSLSLQVWVVCITTVPVQRYIIMSVTGLVACVAVGFRAAFTIINIRETSHHRTIEAYPILVPATAISQAVSICVYSCVFTYKLGHAIMQRRKLKMTQFGPMQVVFIMGCQTMFIPGTSSLPYPLTNISLTHTSPCINPPIQHLSPRSRPRPRHAGPDRNVHLPPTVRHLGRRRQRNRRRNQKQRLAPPPHPERILPHGPELDVRQHLQQHYGGQEPPDERVHLLDERQACGQRGFEPDDAQAQCGWVAGRAHPRQPRVWHFARRRCASGVSCFWRLSCLYEELCAPMLKYDAIAAPMLLSRRYSTFTLFSNGCVRCIAGRCMSWLSDGNIFSYTT